jgi:hypothetical protein
MPPPPDLRDLMQFIYSALRFQPAATRLPTRLLQKGFSKLFFKCGSRRTN